MTSQEQRYVHFVSSIDNLNDAWRILQLIKESGDSPLVGPAFMFALIEYSKPYKTSRGDVLASHRLDSQCVPTRNKDLHAKVLEFRDTILAHTDLTVKESQIYVLEAQSGKKTTTIVQTIINPTDLLAQIDNIIDLIEATLLVMYDEVKKLEQDLPLNYPLSD